MFSLAAFLLGDLGCLASGFVAKFFHDRGVSLIDSQSTFTIAAVIMMTIGLVSIVENPYIAVLLISIGAFSHQCLLTVAATLGAMFQKRRSRYRSGYGRSLCVERSVDFQPVHRGIRSHYRLRAVLYCPGFILTYWCYCVVDAYSKLKMKDPQVQISSTHLLNKNAIIEVMAFLKKLELSNLAYQRVVSHLPPPWCIVISVMSDFDINIFHHPLFSPLQKTNLFLLISILFL